MNSPANNLFQPPTRGYLEGPFPPRRRGLPVRGMKLVGSHNEQSLGWQARPQHAPGIVPKPADPIFVTPALPDVITKLDQCKAIVQQDARKRGIKFSETAWRRSVIFITKLGYELHGRKQDEMKIPRIYPDPEGGLSIWWKTRDGVTATLEIPDSSEEFATFAGSSPMSRHSEPLVDDEQVQAAIQWLARSLCPTQF
jgi:hypothetical protein